MVSLGDVRRNRTFIVAAAEIETVLMAAGLN
jgi:hypothetical protein